MKIPKKIKVLGVDYKIVQKDKLENNDGELSDSHLGWCIEGKRTIELATTDLFNEELKQKTLFHELVHAIMAESGLSHAIEDNLHEPFAQCLGNGFYQVFKQLAK